MRIVSIASLLLISAVLGLAQTPPDPLKDAELPPRPKAVAKPPEETGKTTPHPTPDSGVHAALADAALSPFIESPFWRYIWIDSTDEEDFKAIVLAVNYISRSSFVYRPEAVPTVGGVLVRCDLRVLFPREADFIEGVRVWEEFAFDPSFSLLLTKDLIELNAFPGDQIPKVKRKSVRKESRPGKEGEPTTSVLVPFEEEVSAKDAGVDVVRLDAPDIDPNAFAGLRALTLSNAPIIEWRYFLFRALSTIKDDEDKEAQAYKTIFGGLYYELAGVHLAKDVKGKEKASDLDLFLEDFGVGNIAAGETFDKVLDRTRGDIRPTMFISEVTGKPRAVIGFHTPSERGGQSWGAITLDVRNRDIDVKSHVALSQLKPKIFAQEVIFNKANGFQKFTINNGKGARVDKVPPDIAADRTIPAPHTPELQPAAGCLRCHGPEHEMWQPLPDELGALIESGKLSVLGELGQNQADSQDRIFGLHSFVLGRPSKGHAQFVADRLLSRARDDFAVAAIEATDVWKKLAGNQTVAKAGTAKISQVYGNYWYAPVSAREALLDIGLSVPAKQAAEVLTKLLDAEGETVLGIRFEDPRLAQLAAGGKIGRRDWSMIRSFSAGRLNKGMAKLLKGAA